MATETYAKKNGLRVPTVRIEFLVNTSIKPGSTSLATGCSDLDIKLSPINKVEIIGTFPF